MQLLKTAFGLTKMANRILFFIALGQGDAAEPIPDDNLGNQMLRNMGWEPGSGLGVNPDSIKTPVLAFMRPKYQGLGFGKDSTITKSN